MARVKANEAIEGGIGVAVLVYNQPRTHEVTFKMGDQKSSIVINPGLNEVPADKYKAAREQCVGVIEALDNRDLIEVDTMGEPMSPAALLQIDDRYAPAVIENIFDEKQCGEYLEYVTEKKPNGKLVGLLKTQLEMLRKANVN